MKRIVVRLHSTAVGYLQALKQKSRRLPSASSVSLSLALVTISRQFEKRGEGWPTTFCLILFSPAGDPFSSAFASDLSIFLFFLHSCDAFLFFFDLYPDRCIVFFYEVVCGTSTCGMLLIMISDYFLLSLSSNMAFS